MKKKGGDEVQWYILLHSRDVPSWVMQAVVMHAFQLRSDYRDVFMLCEIQGHSIPDTAAILGIGPTVVANRLKQARRKMGDAAAHLRTHRTLRAGSTSQPKA
jgi:DNA-directed RNA polymerase specialized sigma24 family protein